MKHKTADTKLQSSFYSLGNNQRVFPSTRHDHTTQTVNNKAYVADYATENQTRSLGMMYNSASVSMQSCLQPKEKNSVVGLHIFHNTW